MGEGRLTRRQRFEIEARDLHKRKQLTALAQSLMHEPAAADDLVQSAIAEAYAPGASAWDPDGEIPFVRHVGKLMIGMAYNDRRRFFRQRVELDGEITIDGQVAGDGAPADEQLDAARLFEQARAVQAALVAAIEKDDPRAAAIYRVMREGVEDPAEIAARVRCRPGAVSRAIKRLIYHGRRIAEEERQRGLDEMRARQTSHAARATAGVSE